MKKIALFPVQKSNAALARHCDMLENCQVIPILAPAHATMQGKDLSALDGGNPAGIVMRADFAEAIEDCDLLYLDDSRFLPNDEIYEECRKLAENKNIGVIYGRTLLERLVLYDEEKERIEWKAAGFYESEQLVFIDVPIISVFTMGNENDQGNVELSLRRFFLNKGYRVSQIGTQEYSTLFGFRAAPHFLFADMDGKRKRLMFNQYVRQIVKGEKPDLLIIGVPEAVMKYNNQIPAGMGDVPCIVQDAVQSDIGVLCTCCQPYTEEYFKELSLFGRYRLNCEINYFHISNSMIINDEDYHGRLEHLPLDSAFVVTHMHDGICSDCGFEIFNSFDEASAQSAFQRMEEELTENYEVLQGGD